MFIVNTRIRQLILVYIYHRIKGQTIIQMLIANIIADIICDPFTN